MSRQSGNGPVNCLQSWRGNEMQVKRWAGKPCECRAGRSGWEWEWGRRKNLRASGRVRGKYKAWASKGRREGNAECWGGEIVAEGRDIVKNTHAFHRIIWSQHAYQQRLFLKFLWGTLIWLLNNSEFHAAANKVDSKTRLQSTIQSVIFWLLSVTVTSSWQINHIQKDRMQLKPGGKTTVQI